MSDAVGQKDKGTGMGQGHVLDLKLPIGGLLGAYGVLLTVYGLVTDKKMYGISLGLNLNLIWGVLMFVIGGGFLLAACLKKKVRLPSPGSPLDAARDVASKNGNSGGPS